MRRITLGVLLVAACGGSGSGGGDGGAADATPGGDARTIGEPGTWTFVPVEGSACMDDSPTGIGINLGTTGKLVIYMEGGGACFNNFTCSGVAHPDGFNGADLDSVATEYGDRGLFNRADPDNPFRDWSYVFLPYCTGDIFAGSNPDGFGGRNQVGYQNVGAWLDVLVPAFSDVTQVVLTGSSAGGFGALYNFDRVQTAFGATEVTLLDDSGPPMGDAYLAPCLQTQVRTLWNLDATLPADCVNCVDELGGGLVNSATYLADKYPDRRFGLISSTTDGVIRLFFGWGYPDCASPSGNLPAALFTEGLANLRDEVLAGKDNFKVYSIDSGQHVWLLGTTMGATLSAGTSLARWVTDLVDGNDGWDHVIP
ncbi:MAG TPA: pectin acetylesterase-family hydrolase [Kofleriaceae bacterium]|nr:pectin acetylesterase-family hydrolase [Kofleriaceae bacterium]